MIQGISFPLRRFRNQTRRFCDCLPCDWECQQKKGKCSPRAFQQDVSAETRGPERNRFGERDRDVICTWWANLVGGSFPRWSSCSRSLILSTCGSFQNDRR